MNRKKILFNMYTLEVGGAEKSLLSILNTIDYCKYDVDLFLYEHKGDLINELPKEVNLLPEIDKYKSLCNPVRRSYKQGGLLLCICRIISKIIANIRKLPTSHMQYLRILYGNKFPEIEGVYDIAISNIWPHDLVTDKVNAKKKIGWIHTDYSKMKIDYKIDFKVLKKLDLIISVSENCKEIFDEIQPNLKSKSVYLENIVSSTFIEKLSNQSIEENYIFEGSEIKILTVARLHYEKGIDRVIEVCRKLKEDGKSFKWYIVGFGCEEDKLNRMINEFKMGNNCYLLGKKVNPYPYFKKCDIYVQPSRFEGKSIAITEAKIFNKPIIITDYNSAKDQIENKKTGLIIENSSEGIFQGVKTIIENNDLRENIINNLRKRSWSNEDEIYKLYKIME